MRKPSYAPEEGFEAVENDVDFRDYGCGDLGDHSLVGFDGFPFLNTSDSTFLIRFAIIAFMTRERRVLRPLRKMLFSRMMVIVIWVMIVLSDLIISILSMVRVMMFLVMILKTLSPG